jgi:uncharacterized protein (TIGR04255 family)
VSIASLRLSSVRPSVTYQRNPLFEVICAINFPPILELTREPPVAFQRLFAKEYPLSEVRQQLGTLTVGTVQEEGVPIGGHTVYIFGDLSRNWKITLEQNQAALVCSSYSNWTAFRGRLQPIIEAIETLYGVSVISRLGLRFRDVIDRSRLGLEATSWSDLIDKRALGTFLFFSDDLDSEGGMSASMELSIPPGVVKVQLGKVTNTETKSDGFLIDTDCFVVKEQPLDPKRLIQLADDLHKYTNVIFQACITDKLHHALLTS